MRLSSQASVTNRFRLPIPPFQSVCDIVYRISPNPPIGYLVCGPLALFITGGAGGLQECDKRRVDRRDGEYNAIFHSVSPRSTRSDLFSPRRLNNRTVLNSNLRVRGGGVWVCVFAVRKKRRRQKAKERMKKNSKREEEEKGHAVHLLPLPSPHRESHGVRERDRR